MANPSLPTFLKWAGGKRRIIEQLDKFLPEKVERYFEPFLGGGSMFFYIKQKYNPKFCHISDINKDLIDTYLDVRDNPKKLITNLNKFKKNHSEKFYYETREKFNKGKFTNIKKSAAFIYLNKTCFNGLFRVNSKNEFNVPFGHHKNPEIFNKKTILNASKLLQEVKITCCDYRKIKERIQKNDFIYLDPCYDPIKKTSFANYTAKKFKIKDRIELFKFMNILKNKNAKLILSNNDLPEIRELYFKENFEINTILSPRAINSIGNKRGEISELVITS